MIIQIYVIKYVQSLSTDSKKSKQARVALQYKLQSIIKKMVIFELTHKGKGGGLLSGIKSEDLSADKASDFIIRQYNNYLKKFWLILHNIFKQIICSNLFYIFQMI